MGALAASYQNLCVTATTLPSGSNTLNIAFYDATSATAEPVAVTLGSSSSATAATCDVTHSFTPSLGDNLSIRITASGGATTTSLNWSWGTTGGGSAGGGSGTVLWLGSFMGTTENGGGPGNAVSTWMIGGAGGYIGCSNIAATLAAPEVCQLGLSNSGAQLVNLNFSWDTTITEIDVTVNWFPAATGNYGLFTQVDCIADGQAFPGSAWTQGTPAGTVTTTGATSLNYYHSTIALTSFPTCSQGYTAALILARDQTISSNGSGDIRLVTGAVYVKGIVP
jgi:hypothetical protein